jgi:flagellar hook-basal body complex protein FliE
MKIETLNLPNLMDNTAKATEKSKTSFVEILKESINKVGELEKVADKEVEMLAKMENKDVHNTMIAIEKADLTFQMMMQIRNKIITAYEEIMRIQV